MINDDTGVNLKFALFINAAKKVLFKSVQLRNSVNELFLISFYNYIKV